MATKVPIYLKRGSRRGKKEKLRDILSSDMISPPLGDFRHTIHIGNGGGDNDLFGDLSFLQGKFHLLPGRQGHSPSQRFSLCGERSHLNRPASICGDPVSPQGSLLLKNAISLPIIGGTGPLPYPVQSSNKTSHLTPASSKASADAERCVLEDTAQERPYLSHASSLLSLHLDLGPSILDDVLQIMDNQHVGPQWGRSAWGTTRNLHLRDLAVQHSEHQAQFPPLKTPRTKPGWIA
ncbi:hypothetical protein SKAU_G00267740 [Synaphobranchus kaupii]|uniref:CRIB domain-containing protein n=1 Tax=Synaphobranchus kaupii TaxID=118154 RepID=A0A9Q1EZW2_SYNKA|nr:hypothetical protein SKAU_G00267740 [Synaphobranchus kaupii]